MPLIIIIKRIMILYPFTHIYLGHEVSANAVPQILLKFSIKSAMELLKVYGSRTLTQEDVYDEQG